MTIKLRSYAWLTVAALLLALAALLPTAAAADGDERDDVHPAVHLFAELFPGERIPVVVRSDDPALPAWVEEHGGTVVREFDLVDAFQAEMPADAVRTLDFTDRADWISLDAPLTTSRRGGELEGSNLSTVYPFSANAVPAWQDGITGDDVTVAVIDSGINPRADFRGRIAGSRNFNSDSRFPLDENGHGTWVAGVIAGEDPRGRYIGVAPGADLLGLKVAAADGSARVSDVIDALQWAVANKDRYDIRVVNISMNSAIADSYLRDPLSAAVEQAWFQGIVVVVSAGNLGAQPFATDHAPANDPYVITVGAFDDGGSADRSDDFVAGWSSRGVTVDGYAKPDVAAPGVGIVSTSGGKWTYLEQVMPDSIVDRTYQQFAGTSASAAVVSGAVALMLERDPSLTPDEVKFRLAATATALPGSDAPGVDAFAATFTTVDGEANGGSLPNEFIDPETGMIVEDSILWRRILWGRILWRGILWGR